MADSRRDFLKKVGASGLALQGPGPGAAAASAHSETVCRVNILTNHVGYLTHGGKKFLVESNVHSLKPDFYLRDLNVVGDHRVFHGELEPFEGDFGRYHVGDFSQFTQPGKYAFEVGYDAQNAQEIQEKYGSRVEVTWYHDSDWFTLASLDPHLTVERLITEYGLTPLDEYIARSTKVINQARAEAERKVQAAK